jgi:gas vesicle protein GvpL/GvpF
VIYLYGVAEAGAKTPDCQGLDGAPVGVVEVGRLAGLYSRHERGRFDPAPAALWSHDRMVEAAMRNGAVLPARFGTTFGDVEALGAVLAAEHDRLSGQLEDVRGCVELAVRVSLPPSSIPRPRNGREYVSARLTRDRASRAAAERTLVPLQAHALRSHRPSQTSERGELTASYLVRAEAVEGFADQVKVLAQRHSELAVSCTGPWPPYSFVGGEDE